MDFFRKILILNIAGLLIIIFVFVYFTWLQAKRVTPIIVPASFGSAVSLETLSSYLTKAGIPADKAVLKDPIVGNNGNIKISLDKTREIFEVSWPKGYLLYSLVIKNLGQTDEINDNKIIFGFTADKPLDGPFFPEGIIKIERTRIEPPININSLLTKQKMPESGFTIIKPESVEDMKKGQRYSIEALFEKESEDQIYVGLLGFTY